MGQKSVYNIITAQQINGVWGIADVAFSITSLRKAQMQMHYEIIANEYPPILEQPRFVWDIMIKCVETGTLVLYRMIESPLNSMYISK